MTQVIITVDLGYGDSGKGTMIDALSRYKQTELVVRYSGGAQATHNVTTPENTHHTFALFGSGTFVPGVKTYLGPDVLIDPYRILVEAELLKRKGIPDALERLTIDKRAPLLTEFNAVINQTREHLRNLERHGSCGMGIYETRKDSRTLGEEQLVAGDLLDIPKAKQKLLHLRERKRRLLFDEFPSLFNDNIHPSAAAAYRIFVDNQFLEETLELYSRLGSQVAIGDESVLAEALQTDRQVLFEGAQGVLLDEQIGFLPYVTGSDVTPAKAHALLQAVGYTEKSFTLGVIRGYMTRHGAGPLVTEDNALSKMLVEEHNSSNHTWQGRFRLGWFDPIAVNYAIKSIHGIDGLAVTCLDQLLTFPEYRFAATYTDQFQKEVSNIPDQRQLSEGERINFSKTLATYTPQYDRCTNTPEAILEVISNTCKTNIVATSSGKTAIHKKINI